MFALTWGYHGVLSSALLTVHYGHITLERHLYGSCMPSLDRESVRKQSKAIESDYGGSQASERYSAEQRRSARESLALV